MADEKNITQDKVEDGAPARGIPEETAPQAVEPVDVPAENPNAVVSQAGALVGDEAVYAVESPVNPVVVKREDAAQVSPEREAPSDKVAVHEVYVVTDKTILDPSSPLAVQIPDAGRGSLDLPIHALANGTVEDVFAKADAEAKAAEDDKS